jgi:hypothetical protein
MKSREQRRRTRLMFELLEGRIALSGIGGIDDGAHHYRHRGPATAEVRHGGRDDGANHDAGDDNLPRHGGKNDGGGHR